MYLQKSKKEVDKYIQRITKGSQDYSGSTVVTIHKVNLEFLLLEHRRDLQDGFYFESLYKLYNNYNEEQELYCIVDDTIGVGSNAPINMYHSVISHIEKAREFYEQQNTVWTQVYGLEEDEKTFYDEIDISNLQECHKYYIYERAIQGHKRLQEMGLHIEVTNIKLGIPNKEYAEVEYIIKLSKLDFKKLIEDKGEEFKSYIVPPLTNKTYEKQKEEVLYYIDYLNAVQGKQNKNIIINEFGSISLEIYRYILFIVMFEKTLVIEEYNASAKSFTISLLQEDEIRRSATNIISTDGVLKKIEQLVGDEKCKEVKTQKDSQGNVRYIVATRLIKGVKHIDLQKQYQFAKITTATNRGRATTYIVEEKIKVG